MRYFVVTDLQTKEERIVATEKELESITGWCRTVFMKMLPSEVYYIGGNKVACHEIDSYKSYYKNLWRDEELKKMIDRE